MLHQCFVAQAGTPRSLPLLCHACPLHVQHVSGDAPIRRLSFAAAADSACVSPEPSGEHATDSMDEDMGLDQEALHQQHAAHWQQQQPHRHPQLQSPAAAAQFSNLRIPQQVQNQEQLLLSPSPPPVQQLFAQQGQPQQLFTAAPGQAPQQVHRPNSVQQQLFAAPTPGSGCQLRPQQLWPGQQPQQQQAHHQQQLLQQQGMWAHPMSPAGAPRPPAMQGSTTPARLFR